MNLCKENRNQGTIGQEIKTKTKSLFIYKEGVAIEAS
jgi:hypothetical protein